MQSLFLKQLRKCKIAPTSLCPVRWWKLMAPQWLCREKLAVWSIWAAKNLQSPRKVPLRTRTSTPPKNRKQSMAASWSWREEQPRKLFWSRWSQSLFRKELLVVENPNLKWCITLANMCIPRPWWHALMLGKAWWLLWQSKGFQWRQPVTALMSLHRRILSHSLAWQQDRGECWKIALLERQSLRRW